MEYLGCYREAQAACVSGLKTCEEILGEQHILCSKLKLLIKNIEKRETDKVKLNKKKLRLPYVNVLKEGAISLTDKASKNESLLINQRTLPNIKVPMGRQHEVSKLPSIGTMGSNYRKNLSLLRKQIKAK
eukprot:TRINITY_DN15715_c0_g2_i1.p1 TRINITY_DN15715_c0_g2~~TRINITY_DN15715_c0_g2_i1.p1  ORF type:complete len:130 (-),score=22.77 TRINITY_DN15715_c0_g2_i1:18-407(-)